MGVSSWIVALEVHGFWNSPRSGITQGPSTKGVGFARFAKGLTPINLKFIPVPKSVCLWAVHSGLQDNLFVQARISDIGLNLQHLHLQLGKSRADDEIVGNRLVGVFVA